MTAPDFTKAARPLLENRLPGAGWSWVKSSRAARVARYRAGGKEYYLKFFLPRSFWEPLKALVRGSRCERAVVEAQRLAEAGFHTPAIVDRGRVGGVEWMVSEGVPGMGLGFYLSLYLRRPRKLRQLAWKRNIIRALGQLVGGLHRQGIVHGDLRLNNVLIDYLDKEPRFYLIDNERNQRFARGIPENLLVKNLVQVNMISALDWTLADRMRFFTSYRQQFSGLGEPAFRRVLTRVAEKTRRRMGARLYRDDVDRAHKVSLVSNVPEG